MRAQLVGVVVVVHSYAPGPQPLLGRIGIRIEDDNEVTADGSTNLSQALPREPGAIEKWMAALRA